MSQYVINGGKTLKGEVLISGNKNAALPCIAATLLSDEKITLRNIPDILDVSVMLKLSQELGSEIKRVDKNTVEIKSHVHFDGLDPALVDSVRGSILFSGPLLARGEKVIIPPPGGDVIGLRRLDTHFLGLSALGVDCNIDDRGYLILTPPKRLVGADIFLDEASVTATENVIMAATLALGESTIYNAACEPHIQNLCNLLNMMGSEIEGIGSNFLRIKGKEKLHGADHIISSDYMETGSFIGLAAATGSELLLKRVDTPFLRPLELGFNKLGIKFEIYKDSVYIPSKQSKVISKTYSGVTNKLDDAPWPGFPADLLSIMTVTATQMNGTLLIHEKMFESRLYFVDYLIRMGADIILCDPHRAVVNGKSRLRPCDLISPDVRAGMAMVIAALATEGKCAISRIDQIERGYESLLDKLINIGADIKKQ
ncbi:MAG: UDP-N-acetylglucosamine 1-carboxyvinyltransferase [Spirochaetales bacterium]|uniref:UDP-N-acetylglucosamine 1-carboxyvinyltransferase n=1 Tax=Bullifex sp. TaxID=2815808 RepID=UPI002A5141F7|nr:UDP-N-acetylglucosamine 1-carboxyvinyltransferase [Bullifex sp.]MDD5972539.1 UDP-N-acetylglucosamine 1-carboxyvinyltransferase [Spirochaetales bacterium]MDD7272084.1 UDP-N-acetylglucosamine 1-carboxyvinyltransferase [Spirochaetales bacterium]MDY4067036.1 UDP-N-acetylglucosamine 1-carboxyvinyltransferase [Bullifex sp.]